MSDRSAEQYVEPREPTREDAQENMALGWGLFAIFLILFAGTFAVGLVYLALD
jgi:hypothetical protein